MSARKKSVVKKTNKRSPAIRAPAQARSQETMDKILAATEELLAERPFERITIQDVAQHSGTGVSSIYARFRDKQALVLGLHAQLREGVLQCLSELSDPERWKDTATENIVASVIPVCVKWYRTHGPLVRAALSIDEPELRERQAASLKFAASKFTALLAPRYPTHPEALEAAIDGAVRMVASVMYVSLIFGGVQMSRRPLSDRALSQLLVQSVNALLSAAKREDA